MDVFGGEGFEGAGFGEGYDQGAYEQAGYEQQPQYYTDGQTYYDESGQPLAPVEGNGTVVDIAVGEEGYTPAYYDGGAGGQQQEESGPQEGS